jgi:hypothetical protein
LIHIYVYIKTGCMAGVPTGGTPYILYQCATNNDSDQPVTVILH